MHQQRPLAVGTDAGDLVEARGGQALGALLPVSADGEAMGLVAQPLQIEEQSGVGRQADLAAAGQMEDLAAGIAVGAL